MNTEKAQFYFDVYKSKMTARDLNESKGLYKKLPFIEFAGDLANNCYIRYTKSGYVLYKKNGYLQPIAMMVNNVLHVKKYREWMMPYIETVVKFIESKLHLNF